MPMTVEETQSVVLACLAMLTSSAAALALVLPPAAAFCVEDDGPSKRPRELLTIKAGAGEADLPGHVAN